MSKPLYAGQTGLTELKAHMKVAYAERKQGNGQGWSQDYFRGWLHGLTSAESISGDISLLAHKFVNDKGYERA